MDLAAAGEEEEIGRATAFGREGTPPAVRRRGTVFLVQRAIGLRRRRQLWNLGFVMVVVDGPPEGFYFGKSRDDSTMAARFPVVSCSWCFQIGRAHV